MHEYEVLAGPDNVDIPAQDAMTQDNGWTLHHRDGEDSFVGRLLGYGSSFRSEHTHDGPPDRFSRRRCPACRWFEIRIFRVRDAGPTQPGTYVVHTLGPSSQPDEITYSRISYTLSPFEVIEFCTVRRGSSGEAYLPAAAARALAQAAAGDAGIKEAYINRAVA